MKDTTTTRMFITSLWEDGSVHLERAELGIAPPGHRTYLRKLRKARNLVESGDVMEFDSWPESSPSHLVGIRTRIEFVAL